MALNRFTRALQKPRTMISLAGNMAVYRIGKKRADVYHLRKDGMVQKDRQPLLWVYRGFVEESGFSERRLIHKKAEFKNQESE